MSTVGNKDKQAIHAFGHMAKVLHNYVALYAPARQGNIELVGEEDGSRAKAAMKDGGILVVGVGPDAEQVEVGDRVRLRANAHPVDYMETENGEIIVFDEMNVSMILQSDE